MEFVGTTRAKHNWPMVRLGDVCEFVYGFPFNSNAFNDKGTGKPLIRIRDVVPGVTNTFTTEPAPSKYDVSDGDLLVGMDGDFNLAQWAGGPALLNQRVCMFKPKPDALSVGFLKHSLGKFLKAIWDKKPFATVKHLSAKDLNAIFLPLPPLSVQREIVVRLEKELAEADSLAANFKRIAELADAEFKAELDEVFARVEGKKVRLGDVCEIITDGDHQPPPKVTSGVPFLVISNVTTGQLSFENTRFVPKEYFSRIPSIKKPRLGDVLLTVTGSFGIPVLVDTRREFCFQRHIALLRSKRLNSRFQCYQLSSRNSFLYFDKVATGAAQRTVSLSSLRKMEMVLPTLSIQSSIVVQLDVAKTRCEKLKATAERGLRWSENLRAAILLEAFTQ